MEATRLVITGRVQGVGFRWSTLHEAQRLGVVGWVTNRTDGTVEVWAEGAPDDVAQLVAWCQEGPQYASVHHVAQHPATPEGFTRFSVR